MFTLHHLGPDDSGILSNVRPGTFDNDIDVDQVSAFLQDRGHEIVVARMGDEVVSFASGCVLLHPDKLPAFFVNEVSTHPDFQRQGLATAVVTRLIEIVRARGVQGIWLATEAYNTAARGLYRHLKAQETGGIVVYDWDDAMTLG